MKNREFIALSLVSLLFGFIIVSLFTQREPQVVIRKYQTREEIQQQVNYMRDSFETIYNKKQLDSTYPFEHSKIPNE